jgi:hypothetical protein
MCSDSSMLTSSALPSVDHVQYGIYVMDTQVLIRIQRNALGTAHNVLDLSTVHGEISQSVEVLGCNVVRVLHNLGKKRLPDLSAGFKAEVRVVDGEVYSTCE